MQGCKNQPTLNVTSSASFRARLSQKITPRANVGRQAELFSEKGFRPYVAVRSAERQTLDLIGIPRSNSCKTKVSDLESSVRGDDLSGPDQCTDGRTSRLVRVQYRCEGDS